MLILWNKIFFMTYADYKCNLRRMPSSVWETAIEYYTEAGLAPKRLVIHLCFLQDKKKIKKSLRSIQASADPAFFIRSHYCTFDQINAA